jgi:exo-beta-1,3-glucanase (GH17 family)
MAPSISGEYPRQLNCHCTNSRNRFSAFDEPWKVRYNEKGKEWEDKWGIMDIDRNIKPGVKIPDCGGQSLPSF